MKHPQRSLLHRRMVQQGAPIEKPRWKDTFATITEAARTKIDLTDKDGSLSRFLQEKIARHA